MKGEGVGVRKQTMSQEPTLIEPGDEKGAGVRGGSAGGGGRGVEGSGGAREGGGVDRTHIGRSWLIKIGLFSVACLVFGLWGLWDARWSYPSRGVAHAEWYFVDHLNAAREANRLNAETLRVADVAEERNAVRERLRSTGRQTRDELFDRTRQAWLDQLAYAGRSDLAAEHVRLFLSDADEWGSLSLHLDRLNSARQGQPQPDSPLAGYDVPLNWAIFLVCLPLGLYLAFLIVRVSGRVYRFDHDRCELRLPGGRTVLAADISEVDKTKWHKYYVTLHMKDGKGSAVTLDLYRYQPLESWVLEMEERGPGKPADSDADGGGDESAAVGGEGGSSAGTSA